MDAAELIRTTRKRHGLSQQRLARRVGTRQSAISRLERGEVSPTVQTLNLVLNAMGEQLQIDGVALPRDYDPLHRKAQAARSPEERLALAVSWNRMAERIFRALAEHGVDYVLIGGMAVQTHGHVRATNDVDLIPAPDPANLDRLAEVLSSLDARVLNPGSEGLEIDGPMLPRATIWQFETRGGGIDVVREVPDGDPFDQLSERALRIMLGEVEVPVVSLDDLIRMKLARGRSVDLSDVAALTDQ